MSNITPPQAARLAFHIDPIKWPGMDYKQGAIPNDLLGKITKLEQWLRNCWEEWNLNDLAVFFDEPEVIEACGEVSLPYGMDEQHKKQQREVRAVREQGEAEVARERNDAGRYTLKEASKFIRDSTGESAGKIYALLERDANAIPSKLKVYKPDSKIPVGLCIGRRARVCGEIVEAYWSDLNEWLRNNLPLLVCPFPKPKKVSPSRGEGELERNAEPAGAGGVTIKGESEQTKKWKAKAREIGEKWMKEERKQRRDPGVIAIARYVEGELSNQNITGSHGRFLDWETIKREALTGITGRPPNGKHPKS